MSINFKNSLLLFFSLLLLLVISQKPAESAIISMSFLAFFTRLFDGIGKIFRDLMKKAKPFLKKEIPAAIAVVNWLKELVESEVVDYATTKIKGDLDNKIVGKAKDILPKLLVELKLFQIAAETETNEAIIKAAVDYLKSVVPEKRYGKYREIADYLTYALVDGKLSWAEIVHAVQIGYDENVNNVALSTK